jgi:hypothetical protein
MQSVRYVKVDGYQLGKYNSTTGFYDGIVGEVQRERVDMAFTPVTMNLFGEPGHFSNVIDSSELVIMSYTNKVKQRQADLSWTVRSLDSEFWSMLLTSISVAILLPILLRKLWLSRLIDCDRPWFKVTQRARDRILSRTLSKAQAKWLDDKLRPIVGAALMSKMLVFLLLSCVISTNLVVRQRPTLLTNEAQLAQRLDAGIMFLANHWSLNRYTLAPPGSLQNVIWTNALRRNPHPFLEIKAGFAAFNQNIKSRVFIGLRLHAGFLKRSVCDMQHQLISDGLLYISPAIESHMISMLCRKHIQAAKGQALLFLYVPLIHFLIESD